MRTIVAGRIITSETEFVEAALGFPTVQDLKDFAEFVEDTSEPARDSVAAENILYLRTTLAALREQPRQELEQAANVVPLPRRRPGAGRVLTVREVRAA